MSSLPDISVALDWTPGPVDKELDEGVLEKLPSGAKVQSISPSGTSAWVQTVRIETTLPSGRQKVYFMKGAPGDRGREMMHGTFESEKAMFSFAPSNVPEPVAWGAYKALPDTYFYLCAFHDMLDDLPDIQSLSALIARIHRNSFGKSLNGQYGFHVATHLANVPNDNSWCVSWEDWFTKAMKRMMKAEEESHGQDEELDKLTTALFEQVIPRLLRPLETGGRDIQPCLIHSDLWPGNIKQDAETDELMIFDSCCYWGHNESDLGPWRASRYRLGRPYIKEHYKHIPISPWEEDADDRNLLYAMAMEGLRNLVEKYPKGYQGSEAMKTESAAEPEKRLL